MSHRRIAVPGVGLQGRPRHHRSDRAFALGELRGRALAPLLAGRAAGAALLLLDNCEHVIGACAGLATELLQGCRGLQILATTQQRLGVSGRSGVERSAAGPS